MAIDLNRTQSATLTTEKQRELVKEAVLLPILYAVIQRDLDKISESKLSLSLPHVVVMQRIRENVRKDAVAAKKTLMTSGIRIWDEVRDARGVRCKYATDGGTSRISLSRDKVRADISIMAGMYVETRPIP